MHVLTDLGVTLAYAAAGIVLMTVGYVLVDLITPGKLGDLIWRQRNPNAAIVLASNIIAVGTIIVAAIVASADNFVSGILSTLGYGALGLAVMALAFFALDLLTPGKLGDILMDPQPTPAAWISATIHVVLGAIIAVAIV
jgi:uncharacterized membrane protein YjfL (UPF0719 family)